MQDYFESQILRLCAQPRTFGYLCTSMQGLYPSKILAILNKLEKEGILIKNSIYWVLKHKERSNKLNLDRSDLNLQKYMGHFNFLKIPHPLDYEWRNTPQSIDLLCDLILQKVGPKDSILAMGMPTIFRGLHLRDITQGLFLIERNKPIIKDLRKLIGAASTQIFERDIFKTEPVTLGKYFCVVMDPPWYSEYFHHFVWLAGQVLEMGGFLVISIPAINTRNGILDERMDWISFCHQQGLCIEELTPSVLEYAMPFFEFNSLTASGVDSLLPFWRKGDLAIFRKREDICSDRPTFVDNSEDWDEVEINDVRIRVKVDSKMDYSNTPLTYNSILKGNDILTNLSTKDKDRAKANMMTSGNRIFEVSNPIKALEELKSLRKSLKLENDLSSFGELISYIVTNESKEYQNYLEWIYYEMERTSY